jgi:hypothetical protein
MVAGVRFIGFTGGISAEAVLAAVAVVGERSVDNQ